MSKTVEEVRRELFQSFAAQKWPHVGQYRRDALPLSHARYGEYVMLESEWQAFNAALDAVEIQLPGSAATGGEGIDECRAAIEQTGLGLKVL